MTVSLTWFSIGVDVHKNSHTLVVVDGNGQQVASKTVTANPAGHAVALQWVRSVCGGSRRWGLEDVRNFSGGLESFLIHAGEQVTRVPPALTARNRKVGRAQGKSDPIDALAVARALLREPDLPVARHDEHSRRMNLLVEHRDDLVLMRTATVNRLLSRLHEIDPDLTVRSRGLSYSVNRKSVAAQLLDRTSLQVQLATVELELVDKLSILINESTKQIEAAVRADSPSLLAIPGCGALMAAKIVGEAADVSRFATEAKFASYAGVAPVPYWSGSTHGRHRFARIGNRQLNRALHTIATVQIRPGGVGEPYYRRRVSDGDTHRAALRCVKRKIARSVFYRLMADAKSRSQAAETASTTTWAVSAAN